MPAGRRALRLGLRQIKGVRQEEMARLVARRGTGYRDLADLRRRAGVSAAALDRLARADAFGALELDRRGALRMPSAWIGPAASSTCHPCSPGPRDGPRPPSRASSCPG